jgi:uroporphyrinogen-III decarboxylase
MMNRRDRLTSTLRGESVDRPAVCFYEIDGYTQQADDPSPYNIYAHPSWQPLLALARERSDRIVMCPVPFRDAPPDPLDALGHVEKHETGNSFYTRLALPAGDRLLTQIQRQDRDVNTIWVAEHLLRGIADLEAYLALPSPEFGGIPDIEGFLQVEQDLGDSGIALIDTPDPLCLAAQLFNLADYTVIALTEPILFRRLLDRFAAVLLPQTEAIARALPGRLWRIYGPEYASPPYLPPRLFREYAVNYNTEMVSAIQRYGGFARIHSHGRLKAILDDIASTGCVALDPIEPPPQGDVELAYVRQRYGEQMVLFGNLEANDLEFLPTPLFAQKIERALRQGTAGQGRGFVLMASSSPYGRELPEQALRNYEKMVELAENW